MADYLAGLDGREVMPTIEPGELRSRLPAAPPEEPERWRRSWPTTCASSSLTSRTGSTPLSGLLQQRCLRAGHRREMLTAVLNANAMLWRTSPAATELEQVVVDWLRQALGLPATFDGLLTDTASTSSLLSLAAARQAADLDATVKGLSAARKCPACVSMPPPRPIRRSRRPA